MTSIGYVRALRARWFPLVAITLAVICLAVLAPPTPRSFAAPSTALEDVVSPAHRRYQTTAVLGIPPLAGNIETQFRTIAFYLRSSAVQSGFAERIGYTGTNRNVLTTLVTVAVVPAQGSVNVTGLGGTREQAVEITNAFIASLEAYLADIKSQTTATALTNAQQTVDDLQGQLQTVAEQIAAARATAAAAVAADPEADPDDPPPPSAEVALLEVRRDSLSASYATALQTLTRLSNAASAPAAAQLTVLTPAVATSAIQIKPSLIYKLWVRILVGLLLGLLLGAAVALVLEHLSRKIASREVAESTLRSRVLAEIPKQRVTGMVEDVVLLSAPSSSTAAAYRMVRAVLMSDQLPEVGATQVAVPPAHNDVRTGRLAPYRAVQTSGRRRVETAGHGEPDAAVAVEEYIGDPRGVGPAASKTNGYSNDSALVGAGISTYSVDRGGPVFVLVAPADEPILPVVVANLAASFAETGLDVIVLRLGAATKDGEVEHAVGNVGEQDVWAHDTGVPGVQVVNWQRGRATAPVDAVVEALRAEGAVVLVDAGRAATAEFAEVAPAADGVLAVCEYGRTRIDDADRSADIIGWSRGDYRGVILAQVPVKSGSWFQRGRRRSSPLGERPE